MPEVNTAGELSVKKMKDPSPPNFKYLQPWKLNYKNLIIEALIKI